MVLRIKKVGLCRASRSLGIDPTIHFNQLSGFALVRNAIRAFNSSAHIHILTQTHMCVCVLEIRLSGGPLVQDNILVPWVYKIVGPPRVDPNR